jgi:hypothetical protein
MNVIVNGRPLEVRVSAVSPLQEILQQIETLLPMTQVITGASLNGQPLAGDWVRSAASTYILAEDRLELFAEDASELGRKAFADSREHLRGLLAQITSVADRFRMDDEAVANTCFVQSIDLLQAYFSVLQESTKLMGNDFLTLVAEQRPVGELVEEIGRKLSDLIEIQKNRDWILLADVLEYELIPILKKLDSIY